MRSLTLSLFVVGLACSSCLAEEPSWENPVRSAAEDEIKSLPGLQDAVGFNQYSGYLNADRGKNPRKFLHYWFVERKSEPEKAPLLLWLNGGPGCSSLGGLFGELGPFSVADDGKTLEPRKYSWNKVANVLFLESPSGVGFSYARKVVNVHTDDSTAEENHLALRSFLDKFPQYKKSPLYLSGESYAGVYLPTLGVLVDADPELNLKGIAIGNGYLDVGKLSESLVFFAYHHGLVGKSTWDSISERCCDGKPPSRETCNLGDKVSWSCSLVVSEITAVVFSEGINPYNIYGECAGVSSNRLSRDKVDKHLLKTLLDPVVLDKARSFHVFNTTGAKVGVEPPCVDEHTTTSYLNQKSVRTALHIPSKVDSWDVCSTLFYVVKYPKQVGGLAPQIKQLLGSKRKLTLMVYNGDVDAVCNFLGDEWFVDDLGQKVVKDYEFWHVGKQIAGSVKHYEGITYVTVKGSGHMVPQDRPREAFHMISNFLNATSAQVEL